jgi:MFS transporter, DHA2 family, lincomycin resistance protein
LGLDDAHFNFALSKLYDAELISNIKVHRTKTTTYPLVVYHTVSLTPPHTSTGFIIGLQIALMIGISMIMMPAQTNGLNQLPPSLYPDGTAIMNTLQQVAGAIGTAVAISIMTAGQKSFMEDAANPQDPATMIQAFTEGVQSSFIFGIIVAIVGVVISFFIRRVKVDHQAN